MHPLSIKNITISPPLVLAPMSGVTCSAFRRLIRELNPGSVGLVATEFLSVEGLTRQGKRTLEMMKFHEEERPISVQIFGRDISRMCDAALMVEDSGADIVDINCGCPAPKVVKKGGGCVLMREPDVLAKILRAVRKTIKIPLTLKIRAGWDSNSINALEIARLAESEGVDALTVHGRTRMQMYRGSADWNIVEQIANELSIPVCGSGDVIDKESAIKRMQGHVAALYIGRASLVNPYIFHEICNDEDKQIRQKPEEVVEIILKYLRLLQEDLLEKAAIGRVKQLICQIVPRRWCWKTTALRTANLSELLSVLHELRR